MLCDGDEPVALATVGLRADQAYCKGFGVIPAYRGRGLSLELCQEMARQARQAGARRLALGVMQANERAVRTYRPSRYARRTRAAVVGDGQQESTVDSGRQTEDERRKMQDARDNIARAVEVKDAPPEQLLAHFAALHPVCPLWSRDLPSLLARTQLQGRRCGRTSGPRPMYSTNANRRSR